MLAGSFGVAFPQNHDGRSTQRAAAITTCASFLQSRACVIVA